MVESEGDGWVGSDGRGRGSDGGEKEGGAVMEGRRREGSDGGEKEGGRAVEGGGSGVK